MARNTHIEAYTKTSPLLFDIAKAQVADHFPIFQYGRNDDIDDAATETVWQGGGIRAFLSAGETLSIVSTSANDTSAGTGARTMIVQGYDNDWNFLSETVTLNGTTPVVTTNTFFRVLRAEILTVGTGGQNAGTLTGDPSTSGSGSRQFHIDIGEGRSAVADYSVLPGFTSFIFDGRAFIGASDGVTGNREGRLRVFDRYAGDGSGDAPGPWILREVVSLRSNGMQIVPIFTDSELAFSFVGPRDIRFEFTAGSNNTNVGVSYTLVNTRSTVL